MLNDYFKHEKKLQHWPPPLQRACAGVRAGKEAVRWSAVLRWVYLNRSWVHYRPTRYWWTHTQRCTDTCDGQILNQMSGVGLWWNF